MTIAQDVQGLLDEQGAYDENRELLKKIIRCVQVGRLRINGLPPDQRYSLAEYLFDDEYCLIDTSRLSPAAKARFHQWLFEPPIKRTRFNSIMALQRPVNTAVIPRRVSSAGGGGSSPGYSSANQIIGH